MQLIAAGVASDVFATFGLHKHDIWHTSVSLSLLVVDQVLEVICV